MKFYSENLKKFYNTAEECVAAEDRAKKEKAAVEKRAAKLKAEKEARLKEVNETMNKANKMLEEYINDYGDVPFNFAKFIHCFF